MVSVGEPCLGGRAAKVKLEHWMSVWLSFRISLGAMLRLLPALLQKHSDEGGNSNSVSKKEVGWNSSGPSLPLVWGWEGSTF